MDDDPIDLQALHADDALIEDIAAGRVDVCDDDWLTALLAAWVSMAYSVSRPRPTKEPTLTITPRPSSEVVPRSDGVQLAALGRMALTAERLAASKGLPEPLRIGATAAGVEASMFMPDFLRWIEVLADAVVRTDHAGYLSVVGKAGGQEWTLRPVHQDCPVWDEDGVLRVCDRCAELPDTFRQPISPEAWRDQRWFELTGRHWDESADV